MRTASPALTTCPVSAAILAGGAATRMGGAVKALLDVDGRTILDRLTETLRPLFSEILLVAKEPKPFQALYSPEVSWRLVLDALPGRSSLTGIHAALANARSPHVFLTACDTPLLQPALLIALLRFLNPEDDVVLPIKPDGYFEPLCAIYSKRCLPHIQAQLAKGEHKIIRFFDQVRVQPLPLEQLLEADAELLSFKNANTPEELGKLRETTRSLRQAQQEGP